MHISWDLSAKNSLDGAFMPFVAFLISYVAFLRNTGSDKYVFRGLRG